MTITYNNLICHTEKVLSLRKFIRHGCVYRNWVLDGFWSLSATATDDLTVVVIGMQSTTNQVCTPDLQPSDSFYRLTVTHVSNTSNLNSCSCVGYFRSHPSDPSHIGHQFGSHPPVLMTLSAGDFAKLGAIQNIATHDFQTNSRLCRIAERILILLHEQSLALYSVVQHVR